MALTNAYCDLATAKAEILGDPSITMWDTQLTMAINSASRQIDGYCGRRFWQDGTVVTRLYHAENPTECFVDDISTSTGLVVKSDTAGDGSYATTLTITTDFLPYPLNAAYEVPAQPYTFLMVVSGLQTSGQGFACYGNRPGVSVTAKFGWPVIPDDVTKACLLQAGQLFKSKDTPFGVAEYQAAGMALRVGKLHPQAVALLERYTKASIG